ncbi:hypothetical protein C8R41DRAFT_824818 [Lentinula lateritia]|uniref:F-box domain-containing protein n=1 Tax=Lentinula lateritia TaxID=40482 RepID=A0ABQ8VK65_9AGAR|nr:hypothetical protein C8R41DRAFT_824818 [Lentinula lateritia]
MSSLRRLRSLRRRQRDNSGRSKPLTITPPTPELIASFISNHNTQEHSPLFNQIPPEIRNAIFLYALLSYEDLSTVYPEDQHYSRPDYRHTSRIDPRILQTCRLIYLESRFLPVMATEHVFWCHRAPPGITYASDPREYFARFTEEQKDRVDRVHFFTQQYYLEGDFPEICKLPAMRPRSLKITLRHGDWWWWEDNHPLNLNDVWSTGLDYSTRLEEVILELETMERDKEQVCLCSSFRFVFPNFLSLTMGKPSALLAIRLLRKNGWVPVGFLIFITTKPGISGQNEIRRPNKESQIRV